MLETYINIPCFFLFGNLQPGDSTDSTTKERRNWSTQTWQRNPDHSPWTRPSTSGDSSTCSDGIAWHGTAQLSVAQKNGYNIHQFFSSPLSCIKRRFSIRCNSIATKKHVKNHMFLSENWLPQNPLVYHHVPYVYSAVFWGYTPISRQAPNGVFTISSH